MELIIALFTGIALSATSGFRVFVPFLTLSTANMMGLLELSQSFAWIGTFPAFIIFAVATGVEILAYFIPWVDNILTTISLPVSAVAGTILTYSLIGDIDPALGWSLAAIGGGGSSLITRSLSTLAHAGSTATSGGVANPVVSFIESVTSIIMGLMAIFTPLIAMFLLLAIIYGGIKAVRKLKPKKI